MGIIRVTTHKNHLVITLAKPLSETLRDMIDLMKTLHIMEQTNRIPTAKDLEKILKYDYGRILRYRDALRDLGLIEVIPESGKIYIKLTEKGKCILECLT